jgi:membrane protein required for colicin V production
MAALDYIIIAVLVVSAALSLMRGFTKEVLSITGWIVSGYAAIFLGPSLKPLLASYITIDWAITGGAMLIVFIGTLIVFSIGGSFVASSIKGTGLGALDRTLGVGFGVLRGFFIVCMAYFGISTVLPENDHPEFITEARLRPVLQTGTKAFIAIVPLDRLPLSVANIGETLSEKGGDALQKVGEEALRSVAREELQNLVEEVQDSEPDTGYKQLERDQMERLIRNTEGVK